MRVIAFVAMAGLGLAAASGMADARVWNDPAGRVSFDAAPGWTIIDQQSVGMTYVVAGNADQECHVLAIPRANTASVSAHGVRYSAGNDAAFTDQSWQAAAASITTVFDAPPTVLSHSSDRTQFWPIQRAELQGARLVHGAIQLRPGLEIQAYCQTYEGPEPIAAYDTLIRSIATPNDAAWQTQAEQQESERTAQQQAADAAAAAAAAENARVQEQNASNRRRNN